MGIPNDSMRLSIVSNITDPPQWDVSSSTNYVIPQYLDSYVEYNSPYFTSTVNMEQNAVQYFGNCALNPTNTYFEPLMLEDGSHVDICYESLSFSSELDEEIKNKAIAKVVPATVQIRVVGNNKTSWSGSGFILDPQDAQELLPGIEIEDGTYFISTNHHVANEAKEITIYTADGKKTFQAEVVRNADGEPLMDEVADTALLMIKSEEELPTAKIGDPSLIEQGDTVLTAGYPLALPKISVTKGIVSQPRQMTGEALLAIQADAAINPGNSGGPLFTLEGFVIGTNTYTFRGANDMSFAQPITEQFAILKDIWEKGEHVRGDIGVDLMEFDLFAREAEGLPQGAKGAMISEIKKGSKADELGLAKGDVISRIEVIKDGEVIRNIELDILHPFERTIAMNEIYKLEPGLDVRLNIYRKESNYPLTFSEDTVELSVGRYEPSQEMTSYGWGIKVEKSETGDILISQVIKDSAAARAGLESDRRWILKGVRAREIRDFELQSIRSLADLKDMLESMRILGVTEMLLYLEDCSNPRRRQVVRLDRDLSGTMLASFADSIYRSAQMVYG